MRAWAKRNKKVPLPKEMKKREENLKKGKIKKNKEIKQKFHSFLLRI